MSIPRRLVNMIGTLLVLAAFVAGTMLIALPVYLESLDLADEERAVAASNQLLVTQIDALQVKEAEMPQIASELINLDQQLPAIPQLDDVSQLVIKAAAQTDATITGIDFADPTGFIVRSTETVLASLPRTATGTRLDEPTTPGGDGTEPATDGTTPPADGTTPPADGTTPPADGTTPSGASGELQFPVNISVTVKSMTAATRFLDELRAGPRLLQIDTAIATAETGSGEDDSSRVTLTVTGLVFVRPASQE